MNRATSSFSYTLGTMEADFAPFVESFKNFCQAQEIDGAQAFDMEVSLEELIVNSFSYGNKNGPVKVFAEVVDGELKVTIEDYAPPFDLLREAPPPPEGDLTERRIGGLGIHLVKNLNDRVEYSGSQKGNLITLFKSVKS